MLSTVIDEADVAEKSFHRLWHCHLVNLLCIFHRKQHHVLLFSPHSEIFARHHYSALLQIYLWKKTV
jgi:hypothetical protein